MIFECYHTPLSRHPRLHCTLLLSFIQLFWPKMLDVEDYVIKCHQCEVNKAQQLKATCFVRPLDIPNIKNRGEMVCATE